MNFKKLKLKKNFVFSLLIAVGVGLLTSAVLVSAADWTAPTASAPTCPDTNPACNAPINIGASAQYKSGALGVGGAFVAYGVASATQFCLGGSCISAWPPSTTEFFYSSTFNFNLYQNLF